MSGQLQLNVYLGVQRGKAADHRRDVDAAETQGGVHAKQPLRSPLGFVQQLIEVIDLSQDPAGVLVEDLALRRKAHPTRRPVDQ
jgi:hypothetical protein